MRYEITDRGDDVEIRVRETGGHALRVLASMQDCQDGRCGCPTDRGDRLAGMDVQASDDEISVRLRPRDGEQLDVGELQACMDYTVAHAQEK